MVLEDALNKHEPISCWLELKSQNLRFESECDRFLIDLFLHSFVFPSLCAMSRGTSSLFVVFLVFLSSLVSAQFNIFDQFFGGQQQQHRQQHQQQSRGVEWLKQHYDAGILVYSLSLTFSCL